MPPQKGKRKQGKLEPTPASTFAKAPADISRPPPKEDILISSPPPEGLTLKGCLKGGVDYSFAAFS